MAGLMDRKYLLKFDHVTQMFASCTPHLKSDAEKPRVHDYNYRVCYIILHYWYNPEQGRSQA